MAEVSSERVELRLVAGLHAERGHLCLGYDLGDRDVEGHLRRAALVGERDVVGAANRGCQLFALRPGAGIVGEPLVVVDAGERAASPLPERLLTADPEPVIDNALGEWGSAADSFASEVRDAYVKLCGIPPSYTPSVKSTGLRRRSTAPADASKSRRSCFGARAAASTRGMPTKVAH
jgi:hypothetical protein